MRGPRTFSRYFPRRLGLPRANQQSTGLLVARCGAALFDPSPRLYKKPREPKFPGLFCMPVVGVEPTRCHHQRILSYSSHSEPNGLNRNKTVFSVTFQNIKNPKKPYKISIFDAKHQKYKQFVPSSIIGSQIPNLRRWRDVGGM